MFDLERLELVKFKDANCINTSVIVFVYIFVYFFAYTLIFL